MQTTRHVHIISAGEHIHAALPAILRVLPTVSRICVIADSETYAFSPDIQVQKSRAATRDAVTAVKEMCETLAIPFSRETVFPPVYTSTRTILGTILRANSGARFTFDLSGGSKGLSLALFSLSPWIGGEVWIAFEKKIPFMVPVPDRQVRRLLANVNHQTILAVLMRNRPVPQNSPDLPFIPRHYLFSQVWPYYVRQRVRRPDPAKPVPQYTHGRTQANDLSQATFSSFMVKLRDAGLVEEAQDTRNRKEKAYRISSEGETAFRFFAKPAANSIINQMLEGV